MNERSREYTLLAIDQATISGFAWGTDGLRQSTLVKLDKGPPIERLIAFRGAFNSYISKIQPDLVLFEDTNRAITNQPATLQFTFGLYAVIGIICSDRRVPYVPVNSATIKRHMIGVGEGRKAWIQRAYERMIRDHGNARAVKLAERRSNLEKAAMVLACEEAGWTLRDHNEADALALLDYGHWAVRNGTLEGFTPQ